MKSSEQTAFLKKLQHQASLQARLHTNRFLPSQLDGLSSFVGRYPWQVLLVLSGLTALGIEVVTRI